MRIVAVVVGLFLGVAGHAAEMTPPKSTVVNVGGGSDPTKLPLAGGTLTGSVTTQADIIVAQSTGAIINNGYTRLGNGSNYGTTPPLVTVGEDSHGITMVTLGTGFLGSPRGAFSALANVTYNLGLTGWVMTNPLGTWPTNIISKIVYNGVNGILSMATGSANSPAFELWDTGEFNLFGGGSNRPSSVHSTGFLDIQAANSGINLTALFAPVTVVGSSFSFTGSNGSLSISGPGAVDLTAGGGGQAMNLHASGNVDILGTGSASMTGTTGVNITAASGSDLSVTANNATATIGGTQIETISGDKNSNVTGSIQANAGANHSVTAIGELQLAGGSIKVLSTTPTGQALCLTPTFHLKGCSAGTVSSCTCSD